MSKERVGLVRGKERVIFVAPHGFDDTNTGIIAEQAATTSGGNAVINWGWKRSAAVDIHNDFANCNSLKHCRHAVVKDEFLDPLTRMWVRLRRSYPGMRPQGMILIVHVHGCGSLPKHDVALGHGLGSPNRLTMKEKSADHLKGLLTSYGLSTEIAGSGSLYSGWSRDNLLQTWRLLTYSTGTNAVQLEITAKHRLGKGKPETTGDILGKVALEMLHLGTP